MKIEMKDGIVTLVSESKREALQLTEAYFGSTMGPKQKPAKVDGRINNGGKVVIRLPKRKECPHCGEKFKNLGNHMLYKHQDPGASNLPQLHGKSRTTEFLPPLEKSHKFA